MSTGTYTRGPPPDEIGGKIGALNTIGLIFLTALVGLYFARVQGIETIRSGVINLYQNKAPIYELISGASIAFAALLLIIPGFFTDLIGFLLLIPLTRRMFYKIIFRTNSNKTEISKERKIIDGEIIEKDKDEL